MEPNFGVHLAIDLKDCEIEKLTDEQFIKDFLDTFPSKIGMTKISDVRTLTCVDRWATTAGVTGDVIIAESHIAVHTFPDNNYAFVDVFSCRYFNAKPIAEKIKRIFGSKNADIHIIRRGVGFNKNLVTPITCTH